ncbi:MAG: hypothetical protein DMF53_21155, partial [Acidobacteria bacterium]
MGSTNGTYINGQPIHGRTVLRSGDRFQTAAVHFKFLHEQDVESAYHLAIYELVAKDGLTEIFNKRKLEEELQREHARAARHQRPLSLIIFDLDEFKTINDTYGHLCGDFILKQVASLARELVRPEQVLARVGGDEFVILAPETGAEGAEALASKLRDRIAGYEHRTFAGSGPGDPRIVRDLLVSPSRMMEGRSSGGAFLERAFLDRRGSGAAGPDPLGAAPDAAAPLSLFLAVPHRDRPRAGRGGAVLADRRPVAPAQPVRAGAAGDPVRLLARHARELGGGDHDRGDPALRPPALPGGALPGGAVAPPSEGGSVLPAGLAHDRDGGGALLPSLGGELADGPGGDRPGGALPAGGGRDPPVAARPGRVVVEPPVADEAPLARPAPRAAVPKAPPAGTRGRGPRAWLRGPRHGSLPPRARDGRVVLRDHRLPVRPGVLPAAAGPGVIDAGAGLRVAHPDAGGMGPPRALLLPRPLPRARAAADACALLALQPDLRHRSLLQAAGSPGEDGGAGAGRSIGPDIGPGAPVHIVGRGLPGRAGEEPGAGPPRGRGGHDGRRHHGGPLGHPRADLAATGDRTGFQPLDSPDQLGLGGKRGDDVLPRPLHAAGPARRGGPRPHRGRGGGAERGRGGLG